MPNNHGVSSLKKAFWYPHVTYIGLAGMSVLVLLSIKFDGLGCILPVVYWLLLVSILFRKVLFLREKLNEIVCRAIFNPSTFSYHVCSHRLTKGILSFILSATLAFSLMMFFYLSDSIDLLIVLADIILYNFLLNWLTADVATDNAKDIVRLWFAIGINCFILVIVFFFIKLLGSSYQVFDIALVDKVIANVQHSCIEFQSIARTALYIELNVQSFKNIPGHGSYILAFIYFFSTSFLPFIGLSLVFNLCALGSNALKAKSS